MTEMQLAWEQSPEGVLCADVVKPEGAIMADDEMALRISPLSDGRYFLSLLDVDGIERIHDIFLANLAEAQATAERMVPRILAGDYDIMACMHCGTDVYPEDVICSSCEYKYHRR